MAADSNWPGCCFKAAVLDTSNLDRTVVCECKSVNDAILISELLNTAEGYKVRPVISQEEAWLKATHRHYKGGLYRVLRLGIHTETKEKMVVYEHLWPHKQSVWIRPVSIWNSPTVDGQVRFEPIGHVYIHHMMKQEL